MTAQLGTTQLLSGLTWGQVVWTKRQERQVVVPPVLVVGGGGMRVMMTTFWGKLSFISISPLRLLPADAERSKAVSASHPGEIYPLLMSIICNCSHPLSLSLSPCGTAWPFADDRPIEKLQARGPALIGDSATLLLMAGGLWLFLLWKFWQACCTTLPSRGCSVAAV